jgi:hypothetical protein
VFSLFFFYFVLFWDVGDVGCGGIGIGKGKGGQENVMILDYYV